MASGFIRAIGQTSREPQWVMKMGWVEPLMTSIEVWSPEWEMSMARPSWFIRRTARSPK